MNIFEKPEPIKILVYLDQYNELVKKAGLYDELQAGHIGILRESRIIGGDKN